MEVLFIGKSCSQTSMLKVATWSPTSIRARATTKHITTKNSMQQWKFCTKEALKVSQYYSRWSLLSSHSWHIVTNTIRACILKATTKRITTDCPLNVIPVPSEYALLHNLLYLFVFACSCWWSKLLFILENKFMLLSGIVQGEGQDMGHPHLPCSQP